MNNVWSNIQVVNLKNFLCKFSSRLRIVSVIWILIKRISTSSTKWLDSLFMKVFFTLRGGHVSKQSLNTHFSKTILSLFTRVHTTIKALLSFVIDWKMPSKQRFKPEKTGKKWKLDFFVPQLNSSRDSDFDFPKDEAKCPNKAATKNKIWFPKSTPLKHMVPTAHVSD